MQHTMNDEKLNRIMERLERGQLPTSGRDWLHLMRVFFGRVLDDIRWAAWGRWYVRYRLRKIGTDGLVKRLLANGYHEWSTDDKRVFWKGEKRITITGGGGAEHGEKERESKSAAQGSNVRVSDSPAETSTSTETL